MFHLHECVTAHSWMRHITCMSEPHSTYAGVILQASWRSPVVCCSALQRVAARCSVLQGVAVCCNALHLYLDIVHWRVLPYPAVCCSALHRVVVCCSAWLCVAKRCHMLPCCSVLQCVAVCCSVSYRNLNDFFNVHFYKAVHCDFLDYFNQYFTINDADHLYGHGHFWLNNLFDLFVCVCMHICLHTVHTYVHNRSQSSLLLRSRAPLNGFFRTCFYDYLWIYTYIHIHMYI